MSTPNDDPTRRILRHGAYLCLAFRTDARRAVAEAPVAALVERLGFCDELDAADGHPPQAVAFLRRVGATPADLADDRLLGADAVVHVAAAAVEPVDRFLAGAARLLSPAAEVSVLRGVVRPTRYTGGLMHELAYAHQAVQRPGPEMPNAFLLPLSKTPAWWAKDWMERHTYFLPRYGADGRRTCQGHAPSAAPGVPCLMRRTYKGLAEPAPEGEYDFLTYFECADRDVPTFHQVCAALRDTTQNPEWSYVREGPLWHGRRVAGWGELFE
ncbi:MAG: hypothetical protein ACRD2Z_03765 [Thermoanaerobaculia bacterium]